MTTTNDFAATTAGYTVIERTGREATNANGFFVRLPHGAVLPTAHATRFEAWEAMKAEHAARSKSMDDLLA